MSNRGITCWKCGIRHNDILLPLSRRAKCPSCSANLHCCRQCRFYDTRVSNQCLEPVAEAVKDKTRANFCGYLIPGDEVHEDLATSRDEEARANLNALFGLSEEAAEEPGSGTDSIRKQLDDLFRK